MVAAVSLIVVVCCCLAMLGIVLSSDSAQLPFLAGAVTAPRASRAGRRSDKSASNIAASYARFSSDLQDESSIEQQQRKCRDRAAADNNTILPEFEFFDKAVSGTKRQRDGLNAMLEAAEAGKFTTLYFESLSRLARESVITMPMLKDLVYNHRVRIISVTENIDSAQPNWDFFATFMSWIHEHFLKVLRAAVLRGQEHVILNDWSNGDWCFGYGSEPIEGSETARRGRNPRPRMRVIINPDHAAWVRQIFHWFVVDNWSLGDITKALTKGGAPKDHRASTPGWHHDYVVRLLRNAKYIGIWSWGKTTTTRDPLTGQIFMEGRSAEEVAKWTRLRPELRIIEDDLFLRAQVLLDDNKEKWAVLRGENGRLKGSASGTGPSRHLLQGVIRCGACGGPYKVCGANAKYLGCANFKRGLCDCKTYILRETAIEKILDLIGRCVLNDPRWVDAIAVEAGRHWHEVRQRSPVAVDQLKGEIEADKKALARLTQIIEKSDEDVDDLLGRRDELKRGLRRKEVELAGQTENSGAPQGPPTREWIEADLAKLGAAVQAGGADGNEALRRLLGGGIVVREQAVSGRVRKFLTGTFTVSARHLLADVIPSADVSEVEPPALSETFEIAFRVPPKWAALADEVKALFDDGLKFREIGKALTCPTAWASRAFAWWHEVRGLPQPDGRKLVGRLERTIRAQELSESAKRLCDQGLPIQEIGRRLSCDRNIVTAAIAHWFESRGLPVPDNRNRRRALNEIRAALGIPADSTTELKPGLSSGKETTENHDRPDSPDVAA
jgi:site-specific DNA recombinase